MKYCATVKEKMSLGLTASNFGVSPLKKAAGPSSRRVSAAIRQPVIEETNCQFEEEGSYEEESRGGVPVTLASKGLF